MAVLEEVLQANESVRDSRLLPEGIPVRGFVYEVESGRLREIS
jgi:carbonic anhydrase